MDHIKFLGVIIDENLSWKNHIEYTNKKISKSIAIICKAKKNVNVTYLRQLYFSFVYPYIIYCVEIWGRARDKYINQLIETQKRIIRIITNSKPRSTTKILFNKLNILHFNTLVYYRIGVLMFKVNQGYSPNCISSLFKKNDSIHGYNTRTKHHLHVNKGANEYMYSTLKNYRPIYTSFFQNLRETCL